MIQEEVSSRASDVYTVVLLLPVPGDPMRCHLLLYVFQLHQTDVPEDGLRDSASHSCYRKADAAGLFSLLQAACLPAQGNVSYYRIGW